MRSRHGANDVMRRVDVGNPVPQGFIQRVFQGLRPGMHRNHASTEQLHPIHIRTLPLDIRLSHINDTLQAQSGGNRRRRHPMLSCARLGNHPGFAHAFGEQRLANGVIDLVCAGVVQVFPLEINLRATKLPGESFREIERRGSTNVISQIPIQFAQEISIGAHPVIQIGEFIEGCGQCLSDKTTTVDAEVTILGRLVVVATAAAARRPGLIHTNPH